MIITTRAASPEDAATLASLGRATFVETWVDGFAMPYTPEDVEAFLASAFDLEILRASLAHPSNRWWLAECEGEPAGFATAGPCHLPHPDADPSQGELKRLYVRGAHQGRGLGRALLETSLRWLSVTFDGPLWLGVWSGNEKAQALYRAFGFEKVGEYQFAVGHARDHEFIFRRARSDCAKPPPDDPRAACFVVG